MTEQEKIKAAQREYHKQWRAANPDKVKEHNRKYWLRRAEKLAAEKVKQQEVNNDDNRKNENA